MFFLISQKVSVLVGSEVPYHDVLFALTVHINVHGCGFIQLLR
jgi:hypothetical protein